MVVANVVGTNVGLVLGSGVGDADDFVVVGNGVAFLVVGKDL